MRRAYGGRNRSVFGAAAAKRVSVRTDELERLRNAPVGRPGLRAIKRDDPRHPDNERKALLERANLSEAQMFAMMNMSADHRHQAIWHYARQNMFAAPPFTFGTFAELRERGMAFQPEGSRYHKLTLAAAPLADAVASHLQREHQIHAPVLVHAKGNFSREVTFRCTCSWSCAISTWQLQRNASRAFTKHLISINTVARIAEAVTIAPRQREEG